MTLRTDTFDKESRMGKPDLAVSLFHGHDGFNCAQAIAAAFCDRCEADPGLIRECSSFGGGKAEGGLCGALYAAKRLAGGAALEVERRFAERCGETRCRALRKKTTTSCRDCVRIAAEILDELAST